ncbi:MAG: cytochrome c [Beijerinckiaceae bacterium]
MTVDKPLSCSCPPFADDLTVDPAFNQTTILKILARRCSLLMGLGGNAVTGNVKSKWSFAMGAIVFFGTALSLPAGASPATCDPNDEPLYGAKLFADHCVTCHGPNATGGQTPKGVYAPDLTGLTQKAKGEFPAPRVADIIRYGGAIPEHGRDPKMPIWAEIFRSECGVTYSRRAVVELMKYLQTLQK